MMLRICIISITVLSLLAVCFAAVSKSEQSNTTSFRLTNSSLNPELIQPQLIREGNEVSVSIYGASKFGIGIEIYDFTGKQVFEGATYNRHSLKTGNLPEGPLYYRVTQSGVIVNGIIE